jgi:WD40 repeat protein
VYDLDFHPQRRWLASGDAGGIVRIWDLASGRTRLRLDHRMNTITAVAFHPVEEKLAVADGRTIRLWDANTGSAAWSQPLPGKQRFKGGLHFDEPGLRIAAAAYHRVALFDARSGDPQIIGESAAAELTALATDGASEIFFTGGANGEIAAWSFADGHRLRRWQAHEAAIEALVISRDGKIIVSAAEGGTLAVWDARSGAVRRELMGWAVNRPAISPDGRLLAALGPRQALYLWDLEGGENDQQVPWREAGIWGPFAFSADGRFLFAADITRRDVAVLWDIESRRIVRRWDEDARRFSSMQLAVTGDDRFLAMGVYGQRFAIWDIQGDRKVEIVDGHRGRLQSLAFSPSGAVASTAEDGRVCLWSADTGELAAEITVGPPGGRVRQVVFNGDGRRLATLNGNGTVSLVVSPAP